MVIENSQAHWLYAIKKKHVFGWRTLNESGKRLCKFRYMSNQVKELIPFNNLNVTNQSRETAKAFNLQVEFTSLKNKPS